MLSFGIIAEGPTDQTVIENILLGYFEDEPDEPSVTYVQPPRPLTEHPGGWGHVFKSLQRKDHEGALQFNDYLVIQIDTDCQDRSGFDVPRREGGGELPIPERINRVIEKLKSYVDATYYEVHQHQFIFAITVDTVECWLLPLLYDNNKAAKTTGCLESANQALRKADQKALSAGDQKFIPAYESASRGYLKRKVLLKHHDRNSSLEIFVKRLDELQARRIADNAAAPQRNGGMPSPDEVEPTDAGGESTGQPL